MKNVQELKLLSARFLRFKQDVHLLYLTHSSASVTRFGKISPLLEIIWQFEGLFRIRYNFEPTLECFFAVVLNFIEVYYFQPHIKNLE